MYVWADLSASLPFVFVCLLSIDVFVFSGYTGGSLFMCFCLAVVSDFATATVPNFVALC